MNKNQENILRSNAFTPRGNVNNASSSTMRSSATDPRVIRSGSVPPSSLRSRVVPTNGTLRSGVQPTSPIRRPVAPGAATTPLRSGVQQPLRSNVVMPNNGNIGRRPAVMPVTTNPSIRNAATMPNRANPTVSRNTIVIKTQAPTPVSQPVKPVVSAPTPAPTINKTVAPVTPAVNKVATPTVNKVVTPVVKKEASKVTKKNVIGSKQKAKNYEKKSEICFYLAMFFLIFGIVILIALGAKDVFNSALTTPTIALVAVSVVAIVGGIASMIASLILRKKHKDELFKLVSVKKDKDVKVEPKGQVMLNSSRPVPVR